MIRRAAFKLKSNSGASITFALLLLLVCAVIGSVVLVAATAAAGRVAGITDMDKRYYAVTSAAELIAGEIKDKSVSVVRKKVETTGFDSDGNKIGTDGDILYSSDAVKGASILQNAAIDLVFGKNLSYTTQEAYDKSDYSGGSYDAFTMTSDKYPDLNVDVNVTMDDDGTLTFTVQNSGEGDKYKLAVIFDADIVETVDSITEDKDESLDEEGNTVVTKELTEIKTTTVTWTLSGIKKG